MRKYVLSILLALVALAGLAELQPVPAQGAESFTIWSGSVPYVKNNCTAVNAGSVVIKDREGWSSSVADTVYVTITLPYGVTFNSAFAPSVGVAVYNSGSEVAIVVLGSEGSITLAVAPAQLERGLLVYFSDRTGTGDTGWPLDIGPDVEEELVVEVELLGLEGDLVVFEWISDVVVARVVDVRVLVSADSAPLVVPGTSREGAKIKVLENCVGALGKGDAVEFVITTPGARWSRSLDGMSITGMDTEARLSLSPVDEEVMWLIVEDESDNFPGELEFVPLLDIDMDKSWESVESIIVEVSGESVEATTLTVARLKEDAVDTQGPVTALAGDKEVQLSWQLVEGAVGYRVYIAGERYPSGSKESGPGAFCFLAEVGGTSYTDRPLNNGYYYFYKVAAVDEAGAETWLNAEPVAVKPQAEGSDTSPPELKSLSIPGEVYIGTPFVVEAEIEDDISGVYQGGERNGVSGSPVQVRLEPSEIGTGVSVGGLFRYNVLTRRWEAEVTIPENYPVGPWKVEGFLLVDWVGNSEYLWPEVTFSVLVPGYAPPVPALVGSDPAPGEQEATVDTTIRVTLDHNIEAGHNYHTISLRRHDGMPVAVFTCIDGATLVIDPVENLEPGTTYTVTLPAGAVKAVGGSALAQKISFSFTTVRAAIGSEEGEDEEPGSWDERGSSSPGSQEQDGGNSGGSSRRGKSGASAAGESAVEAPHGPEDSEQVTFEAEPGVERLTLHADQLTQIAAGGQAVEIRVGSVEFALSPEVLDEVSRHGMQVEFAAGKVEPAAIKPVASAGLHLVSEIFDLNISVVGDDGTKRQVERFKSPIWVSLPVPEDMQAAAAAGRLVACCYWEEKGVWEVLGGAYEADKGVLTFETDHLSQYAIMEKVTPLRKTFGDIQSHWAQADIEVMAGLGVVAGAGADRFDPNSAITRAQFAALLARSLGIQETRPAAASFKDVSPGAWYYGAVGAAHSVGLVVGYNDGTFRPSQVISREEIAVVLARALAWAGKPVAVSDSEEILGVFTDVAFVDAWARQAAAQVVAAGIVCGRPGGRFAPRESATRAEAVMVLKRMLVRLGYVAE